MPRALILLLLVLATPAHAERKAAEMYFRSGAQAYRAQSFADAAHDFELAYKEYPAPEIAFSCAQAYRRQYRIDHDVEKLRAAVAMYEAYLAKVSSGGRARDPRHNPPGPP